MESEYIKLAVRYNTLRDELFKAAFKHPNNKALLNLIKDVGLCFEYTYYCANKKKKIR